MSGDLRDCGDTAFRGPMRARRDQAALFFRHIEDLDTVFESDTCDILRQVICAFQPPARFLMRR